LVGSSIKYDAIATTGTIPRPVLGSGTLTLLDYRLNEDVMLAGQPIGDIYDFVFRDSRDNKLVFGTRVLLGLPGQQQNAELNNVFRYGFEEDGTTFAAAAAWLYMSPYDLRLYSAARSDKGLLQTDVFDPDAVSFQSDINLSKATPTAVCICSRPTPCTTRWRTRRSATSRPAKRSAGGEGIHRRLRADEHGARSRTHHLPDVPGGSGHAGSGRPSPHRQLIPCVISLRQFKFI
jgi:hypothetical protein